jgi:large subunit ribosomal protein L9
MQVILLNDLYKHGVAGEIVKVADGFARNFLIPRKMARRATDSALRETEAIRKNVEARRAQYDNMLNDLAQQIDNVELIFGRRSASTGKLFGSVTTQEIADTLMEKTEVDLNRRRISQHSLREIGTHKVTVRLGNEISPKLVITIVPEDELQNFLAAREQGIEVKPEDLLDENFVYPKVEAAVVEDANDLETEVIPEEVVQEALEMEEATIEESDESDE